MAQNLSSRLDRIRKAKAETADAPRKPKTTAHDSSTIIPPGFSDWQEAGHKVLRRNLTIPIKPPATLPVTLPALLPDLATKYDLDRFLFFDLETTGLSGGAGTVAFLAAFGRFNHSDNNKKAAGKATLEVTQILLLDYPGEPDFLERALEIIVPHDSNKPYYLTTYNGKTFDIPLLTTRCIVNRCDLPPFLQLDLLHPARRMWKRFLPNCSQSTIETLVLGLDRAGDTPGSLAPEIWFNFLQNGGEDSCKALSGICNHNVKDIFGLASVFCAFTEIAADPLKAAARFRCDEENLALRWRHAALPDAHGDAALLLEAAALHYPRASLRLGFDLFRQRRYEEGRLMLSRIALNNVQWKVPCTITVQALALRSLAIDAERRLKQPDTALSFIDRALALEQSDETIKLPGSLREVLQKRRERLKG